MKKFAFVFVLVAAVGLVAAACDDDKEKNACEKAADIMKDGMDSYCNGKSDTCWSCDCYNQNMKLNVTVDGTTVTYACGALDPVTETTCDGTTLTSAENCTDNAATCESDASDAAQAGCDATTK